MRHFTTWLWVILGRVSSVLFLLPARFACGQPVEVAGQILSPDQRAEAIVALGLVSLDPSTAIIGFDIKEAVAALCQTPNRFFVEDDGIPISGPDISGGPFTGVDFDAVGGIDDSGNPIFANSVSFVSFGPKIEPAPNTSGACLDTVIDGLFGDDAIEGFPGNVLGPPDAS